MLFVALNQSEKAVALHNTLLEEIAAKGMRGCKFSRPCTLALVIFPGNNCPTRLGSSSWDYTDVRICWSQSGLKPSCTAG